MPVDALKIRNLWGGMSKEEQDSFINEISEEEAGNLLQALKATPQAQQPVTVRPEFTEDYWQTKLDEARAQDPEDEDLWNMTAAEFRPDVGLGIEQGIRGVAQGLKRRALQVGEAVGLAEPGAVTAYQRQVDPTVRGFEQTVGATPGGKFGRLAGSVAPFAFAGPVGAIGRTAIGAGIGAAQYVGEDEKFRVPFTETEFNADYANPIAGGALAFAAPVVLDAGVRGVRAGIRNLPLRPKQMLARMLKRAEDLPTKSGVAQEFDETVAQTGQRSTLSSRSGSKEVAAIEAHVARSGKEADVASDFITKEVQRSFELVDDVIARKSVPAAKTGRLVRMAVDRQSRKLNKALTDDANKMFGEVRQMVDDAGMAGNRVVNTPQAAKVFDERIADAIQTGGTKAFISRMAKYRDFLTSPATVSEAMARKVLINKASRGETNLFSGDRFLTKDDSIEIAKKLARLYEDDMQKSMVAAFGDRSGIYQSWRKANEVFKTNLSRIDDLNQSSLGKLLGKKDQAVRLQDYADDFMKMNDQQLSKTLAYLNPVQKQQVVRHIFDRAREKATILSGAEQASDRIVFQGQREAININSFLNNLGNRRRLLSLFDDAGDRQRMGAILKGMERQADRIGSGGVSASELSAGATQAGSAVGLALNPSGQSPIFFARQMYLDLMAGKLSKLLFTKSGQEAVLKVVNTPIRNLDTKRISAVYAAAGLQLPDRGQ